jgi:poly(3-hydroxyalkanoate) synthetase
MPTDPSQLARWFFWPLAAASQMIAMQADGLAQVLASASREPLAEKPQPAWTTTHSVCLALPTMVLRDFSTGTEGVPCLICAPFALHGAALADFAVGHSLVQTLAHGGCQRLFVTDWRSATQDMRLLTLDNYLAELNVAVDAIGSAVDLVGLCQGGVMALLYAARFPGKVRRLVVAGAPVDIDAAPSLLSMMARVLPLDAFDELVRLGQGRLQGRRIVEQYGPVLADSDILSMLQVAATSDDARLELLARFRTWVEWAFDLPGPYYHQTVQWLFRENRLASGSFPVLGRTVGLGQVRHPLFLLAAQDDELVAAGQIMAAVRQVGTATRDIEQLVLPGRHLSLFMGARNLSEGWEKTARWLAQS